MDNQKVGIGNVNTMKKTLTYKEFIVLALFVLIAAGVNKEIM